MSIFETFGEPVKRCQSADITTLLIGCFNLSGGKKSFADIFFNNMFKNGMLPLILPQKEVDQLAQIASEGNDVEIDLVNQRVNATNQQTGSKVSIEFSIDPFRKKCLVEGLDDIRLTELLDDKIKAYEAVRSQKWPWLDGIGFGGKVPIPVGGSATGKNLDW
jgi:3-isopropylmalate dehydratase